MFFVLCVFLFPKLSHNARCILLLMNTLASALITRSHPGTWNNLHLCFPKDYSLCPRTTSQMHPSPIPDPEISLQVNNPWMDKIHFARKKAMVESIVCWYVQRLNHSRVSERWCEMDFAIILSMFKSGFLGKRPQHIRHYYWSNRI